MTRHQSNGENVLTFWQSCCRLKYTWTENENLWNVRFNKKWQAQVVFSLSLEVLEVQFGKNKTFKWKRDWGEHSLHCLRSLGIKLSPKCFGSVYFASWGNSSSGALLPLDKQNCLKWSHDKFKTHNFLTW